MPKIGSAYVPHVLEDDIGQSVPTETVPDPDGRPRVESFRADLSQGTISFLLHPDAHPDNESVEEQRDAVTSLVQRKAATLPFEQFSERGHLSVQSVSIPKMSARIITGDMTIRYLPANLYQPSIFPRPKVLPNDFGVSASGVVAAPVSIDSAVARDTDTGQISYPTAYGSLPTPDGNLNLYSVQNDQYTFDYPTGSYADGIDIGSIRVFEHNNSTDPDNWTRIYRESYMPKEGVVVSNGFIRYLFSDPSDGNLHINWYNGSDWVDAGHVEVDASRVRLSDNGSERAFLDLPNGTFALERGRVAGRFDLFGLNGFEYDTSTGDYPLETSMTASNDVYAVANNSNISFTYILAYPNDDITKSVSGDVIQFIDYSDGFIFPGVYPSSFTTQDTAHRIVTEWNNSRDLINRREL